MAERREFDFFNYIFSRDGEEDEPTTEPLDEDAPFVDLTVDSDEDGASNSAAAIQQNHPQSNSRQPRRTQTGQLKESATDSEEEQDKDESSSDEETSSEDRSQKSREKLKCPFSREHHLQPTRAERQGCSPTCPRFLQR